MCLTVRFLKLALTNAKTSLLKYKTMEAPGDGLAAMEVGAEAITWGGLMQVLLDHDKNPNSEFVSFCEVIAKDPFLVFGR